jgi:hypothetical protein
LAQCPACGNQLNDDFGLVDCARCGAALFIEFDGSVQRRDEVGGEPANFSPAPDSPPEALADAEDSDDQSMGTGSQGESLPMHPAPPMVMADMQPMSEGMEDLSAFANSNISSGRDGAYNYDLYITGIDTGEVRNAINEILRDQLFLWDAEALLRSIHNGELKLTQITSVKAALMVQRLGELPVRVKWVQHALVEP